MCCVGAILSVKLIKSSAHCLSLAADCSLRRWSLMNGQQLLCIQEAVPVDSTPSSVHLHLCDQSQLMFVYTCTQVLLHVSATINTGITTLVLLMYSNHYYHHCCYDSNCLFCL